MRKELFEELLQSVKQAKAIERGDLKPSRTFTVNPKSDIARVRGKLGLSQPKFASLLGISQETLQNWEQGRTPMDPSARALMTILAHEPKAALRALGYRRTAA